MISVCLATYNGEKYIKEQLDSILIQLGENDEVIVSDDGSTDNTLQIIRGYNDSRIKIFSNDNRKGVVGNFENALKKAMGDYIFLSDQDDVWVDDKVMKSVEALQNADLIVSDCYVTDSELNIIHSSFFQQHHSRSGFWKNLWRNSYVGACVAFRGEILRYVLPIPSSLPVYHEGWISSLADIKGRVVFYEEPLIYFRRHENNVSCTAGRSGLSFTDKIKNRLLLLYLVMNRIIKLKYGKK